MTLVLLVLSLAFSFGGDSPPFFGNYIYIVKTDEFPLVSKGAAVIAEKAQPDLIKPGNIVIYQNSQKRAGLAEIHTADMAEGVYSFTAASENAVSLILSQGQILGVAVQKSNLLGILISFAVSPAGVLVIAVLPCAAVVMYELVKFIMIKAAVKHGIRPVKKQQEIPTFIPRQKAAAVINAYTNQPESQNDYDMEEEIKRRNPAYKASDLMGIDDINKEGMPFFKPAKKPENDYRGTPLKPNPQSVTAARQSAAEKVSAERKGMPVSQKRLNEVIAETNRERARRRSFFDGAQNNTASIVKSEEAGVTVGKNVNVSTRTDIGKTAEIDKISDLSGLDKSKRFIPRKQQTVSAVTASMPRLDKLLSEEPAENMRYNIQDILNSLEKR